MLLTFLSLFFVTLHYKAVEFVNRDTYILHLIHLNNVEVPAAAGQHTAVRGGGPAAPEHAGEGGGRQAKQRQQDFTSRYICTYRLTHMSCQIDLSKLHTKRPVKNSRIPFKRTLQSVP